MNLFQFFFSLACIVTQMCGRRIGFNFRCWSGRGQFFEKPKNWVLPKSTAWLIDSYTMLSGIENTEGDFALNQCICRVLSLFKLMDVQSLQSTKWPARWNSLICVLWGDTGWSVTCRWRCLLRFCQIASNPLIGQAKQTQNRNTAQPCHRLYLDNLIGSGRYWFFHVSMEQDTLARANLMS